MWEVFNNREIATFVWLIIILLFVLCSKDVRTSLMNLLNTVLSFKLLFPLILLAIYIGYVVYFLFRIELWTVSLLKDTLFWFFTAGLLTVNKYISAKNGKIPIKEVLFDNLKLIVLLEFLLNTYTFSIWAELIIVPVVTITLMLKAFVEVKKENRDVEKFIDGVLVVFGTLFIAHAFYYAVQDIQTLGTIETLLSLMLPIFLSIAIIPYAYLLAVYAIYEELFAGFKLGKTYSFNFRNYCKFIIIMHCGFSTRKIGKLIPFHLMHLQSVQDLKDILQELDKSEIVLPHLEE